MKNLIEQARTCHGEHTTHGKFIQDLADYAEAAKRDASLVELTSKLAITAIEHSELYQAAKRDAEEAEAYAASLESDLNAVTKMLQKSRAANVALEDKLKWVIGERDTTFALMLSRAETAEVKLAKEVKALVEVLKFYGGVMPVSFSPGQDGGERARAALALITNTGGNADGA